ncbi:cornifelin homolog B [Cynoglossus semilaevis]|uniref:cornifelin homolog B n=1 Tax=Cynoglossus semilaevis TaxID=244447 RepID=UPI00049621E5|nr:cornifelin homolog B-like [Cynoglossus semilaevis]
MSNTMVIKQPEPVMVLQDSDQWGSRICDCCQDVPECCFAFWCCPCFACKITDSYGEGLCLPLLDIFGMVPPITFAMRVSMRHRYGISGSICGDCIYASFCTSCSWCQMSREMKRRKIQVKLVSTKRT